MIFLIFRAVRLANAHRRAFRFTPLGTCHGRKGGKTASSGRRFPPTAVGSRLRFVPTTIAPAAKYAASPQPTRLLFEMLSFLRFSRH